MGLTQSKLAVGDLIFDARLCGPEGGAVVVLLHGWPEFSSWWQDSLETLGAAGYRAVAFDQRGYSEEDGWRYPYSLFDNFSEIARLSTRLYIFPTRPATGSLGNLLFSQ